MNRKMIFYLLGQMSLLEAGLMLLPLAVSLIYGEASWAAFLQAIIVAVLLGLMLMLVFKPTNKVIYAKEGFIIVSLAWIVMSVIGALPFTFSGEIPSFVDAVFETVSGFTTTGASVITNVEALSHGTLFWRSFTHWIGGMGVLVLVMAVLPTSTDRSIHIIKAEMPGPVVGKLVPKVSQTAKILYLIYVVMTVVETIMLWLGDMNLFEALVYSFGTAGTGGFAITSSGLAEYSAYSQWVITAFLVLFGVNFNLYFLLLIKKFKAVFSSEELWTYFGIILASIGIITYNIYAQFETFSESFRTAAFHTLSVMSTAGYTLVDMNNWPELSKSIVIVLMFIGACAGSTAGGFKLSRVILLVKSVRRELKRTLHPRSVATVKFEGKRVEEQTTNGVAIYLAMYMAIILVTFLIISFEPFSFETRFTTVVSCFNNIGPIFGYAGANGTLADYSDFSKIILTFTMLLGRLEVYPLIIALSPSTWSRR